MECAVLVFNIGFGEDNWAGGGSICVQNLCSICAVFVLYLCTLFVYSICVVSVCNIGLKKPIGGRPQVANIQIPAPASTLAVAASSIQHFKIHFSVSQKQNSDRKSGWMVRVRKRG